MLCRGGLVSDSPEQSIFTALPTESADFPFLPSPLALSSSESEAWATSASAFDFIVYKFESEVASGLVCTSTRVCTGLQLCIPWTFGAAPASKARAVAQLFQHGALWQLGEALEGKSPSSCAASSHVARHGTRRVARCQISRYLSDCAKIILRPA
jgi:hypothetical protein